MASRVFPLTLKTVRFDATTGARVVIPKPDVFYTIGGITATSGSSANFGANILVPADCQGPIFMMPAWLKKRITCELSGLRDMSGTGYANMFAKTVTVDDAVQQFIVGRNLGIALAGSGAAVSFECTSAFAIYFGKGTISTGSTPFSVQFKFAFG